MDFTVISQVIGSLGFPIAMCIYMVYVNQSKDKAHAEEQKHMTEALNELKLVIQKILDKLETMEG